MVRWGMIIDLEKCTGCQSCSLACTSENNLPIVPPEASRKRRYIEWNEMIVVNLNGLKIPTPRLCMNCDIAPCVKVCPTGSRFYIKDGKTVLQSYDRCIGCRMCMVACPYNVNYFMWSKPDEDFTLNINSDMVIIEGLGRIGPNIDIIGTPQKCIFCFHRLLKLKKDLENGKAGALSKIFTSEISWETVGKAIDIIMRYLISYNNNFEIEGEEIKYLPACVATCPTRARIFGDLDDKDSLAFYYANSERAFKFLEEIGTEPKVIYLRPISGGGREID